MQQKRETGWIRMVCLKARQVGLSTMSEAMITNAVMLNPNTNGLVVAHDASTAETLFSISKTFYDNLDTDIKPLRKYSTKRDFYFENPDDTGRAALPGLGSRLIIASANNIAAGIGRTLRAVHLSEAARYPHPEAIIDGIFPALAKKPGTICIFESTAQYSGKWFRDVCERAKRRDGDFRFIFVPWYLQPDYAIPLLRGEKLQYSLEEKQFIREYGLTPEQIKFFRQERLNTGNDAIFSQNYPFTEEQAWITPGDQVFPSSALDRQIEFNVRPPLRVAEIYPGPVIQDSYNGRLQIWKEPEKGRQYDVGVDVAGGVEASDQEDSDRDWSVMQVVERGSLEQVAEWRSRSVDAVELADYIYALGTYYNRAQVAVEVNGIGLATSVQLSKKGYSNLWRWRFRDEAVDRITKKVGWETTRRTKKWLISFAVHELNNNRIIIHSKALINEMRTFVHLGYDTYGGAAGEHDDLISAALIAWTISDDENVGKWNGGERRMTAAAPQPGMVGYWNSDPTDLRSPKKEIQHAAWD